MCDYPRQPLVFYIKWLFGILYKYSVRGGAHLFPLAFVSSDCIWFHAPFLVLIVRALCRESNRMNTGYKGIEIIAFGYKAGSTECKVLIGFGKLGLVSI